MVTPTDEDFDAGQEVAMAVEALLPPGAKYVLLVAVPAGPNAVQIACISNLPTKGATLGLVAHWLHDHTNQAATPYSTGTG